MIIVSPLNMFIPVLSVALLTTDVHFKKHLIISLTTALTAEDITYTQWGHNGIYC